MRIVSRTLYGWAADIQVDGTENLASASMRGLSGNSFIYVVH